jgi:galactokinase
MRDRFEDMLQQSGMGPPVAATKAQVFETLRRSLVQPSEIPAHGWFACFVPGRIEVLGKHTDYAGGRSLLCTVERGFSMVSRPRSDRRIRIVDIGAGERLETSLDPDIVPATGHWSNYPMTVARRLARNFPHARTGIDLAFISDLPPASGMSSSSAFIVGVFLALADANSLQQSAAYRQNILGNDDLAGYLGTVENGRSFRGLTGDRGVGTFGGSEDHTAILSCRPGVLSQYSFCPVRHELDVALPPSYLFVVGGSGVQAEKTGAALQSYNRAASAAQRVLELWNQATGRNDDSLAAAVTSQADALGRLQSILAEHPDRAFAPGVLAARFRQFFEESFEIVGASSAALAQGDIKSFGLLVDRSQQNAELLLGNQIQETMALCRIARESGAAAASAFGAGFGGSVWALIEADRSGQFLNEWSGRYRKLFPEYAEAAHFFPSSPGPAVIQLRWPV